VSENERFWFDSQGVRLTTGEVFYPDKQAKSRWVARCPAGWLRDDLPVIETVEVFYQSFDDRFVYVGASVCPTGFPTVQLDRAELVPPAEALAWLLANGREPPECLTTGVAGAFPLSAGRELVEPQPTPAESEAGRGAAQQKQPGGEPPRATPEGKPKKRRGRKGADEATRQREAEIATAWELARKAGTYKADFARDNGMTAKQLSGLLDRVRRRRNRSE